MPIAAQPVKDSLLLHYREMALSYDDDLKAATKRIESSLELERAARADRTPSLSAGGDFRYTGNPLEYTAKLPSIGALTLQGQELKYGVSATLLQPIYTGGRINSSIRMAETETRMSEAQRELIYTEVCYRVDVQYWTTVARHERMVVAEEYLQSIAELEQIVRERVEAGFSDKQELLTVEVKHNEARYRLMQPQNELKIGRMAFNALIGLPLETQTPVESSLPEIDAAESTRAEESLHPEIRLAQERINWEKNNLRLRDASYKPQLMVGANAGYFAPGYNFRPDLSPNYTIYAQVSVPILQGGKRHRERKAAEYRIGMAADALHRIETDLEVETNTARTALGEARERVSLASSSLAKAFENERRAMEKYEEGAISVSEVIDAQVYRQTAQENLIAAKAAVQIHLAELSKATNAYLFQ